MARSKSSHRWLRRQAKDPYVKEAKSRGLRSRAALKLEQLQQQYQFLKPNMRILDLGAAPGSWSEYMLRVCPQSKILAIDREPMKPLAHIEFMQMDIYNERLLSVVHQVLGDDNRPCNF